MVKYIQIVCSNIFTGGRAHRHITGVLEMGSDLPPYHQLSRYEPPVASRVHAGNGALLAEFHTKGFLSPSKPCRRNWFMRFYPQKIKPLFSTRC